MTEKEVKETAPGAGLAGRWPLSRVAALQRRGSSSFLNISFYSFGLSGLWTAMGSPILPIKVQEILENGSVTLFGVGMDKNGTLGVVTLAGLFVAALAQPLAGVISDRRHGRSKRLPFIMAGAIGMGLSVLLLGVAGSFLALALIVVLVQIFGNIGQGPANALIADHVSPGQRGTAAGWLTLARVAGAGIVTLIVFLLMTGYDRDEAAHWLWISLALMASVAIGAASWTVLSLRRSRPPADRHGGEQIEEQPGPAGPAVDDVKQAASGPDRAYIRFLVALAFVVAAMSSLQLYSFFYLEDVIGLENPTQGGVAILLTTALATALTVIPAGKLADRVGRDRLLIFAGGLGVIASVVLMLANSLVVVAIDGLLVGVVIGIFLPVSWAVANDLVAKRTAARDLGYTSLALFVGASVARVAGLGIDSLNAIQPALGYQMLLVAVAGSFVVSAVLMTRLTTLRKEPGGGPALLTGPPPTSGS